MQTYEWVPIRSIQKPPIDWTPGRCGVCKREGGVKYCPLCGAVICPECRFSLFPRGIAALRAKFIDGYYGEILVKNDASNS